MVRKTERAIDLIMNALATIDLQHYAPSNPARDLRLTKYMLSERETFLFTASAELGLLSPPVAGQEKIS